MFSISGQRFSQPISLLIWAIRFTAAIRTSLLLSQRYFFPVSRSYSFYLPNLYLPIILDSTRSRAVTTLGGFSLMSSQRRSQQRSREVRGWAGSEISTSSQVSLNFQLLCPMQSPSFSRMYWTCLEAAPICAGLNFFIIMPKQSTRLTSTEMILSSISLRTTKTEATMNSSLSFFSRPTQLSSASFIISIPFSLIRWSLENRYSNVISLKMVKYLLHSSNCCGVSLCNLVTEGRACGFRISSFSWDRSRARLIRLDLLGGAGGIFFLPVQSSFLSNSYSIGYLSFGLILISSKGITIELFFFGVLRSKDRLLERGYDCLEGSWQWWRLGLCCQGSQLKLSMLLFIDFLGVGRMAECSCSDWAERGGSSIGPLKRFILSTISLAISYSYRLMAYFFSFSKIDKALRFACRAYNCSLNSFASSNLWSSAASLLDCQRVFSLSIVSRSRSVRLATTAPSLSLTISRSTVAFYPQTRRAISPIWLKMLIWLLQFWWKVNLSRRISRPPRLMFLSSLDWQFVFTPDSSVVQPNRSQLSS